MAQTLQKELPKSIVDTVLPEFFETYPDLTLGTPCSWITWSNDLTKVYPHITEICHAYLLHDYGADELITSVPNKDTPSLTYQRMLINGPFKAMADLISLEQWEKEYFIRCSNLEKWPSKVLYNYCIATRVPVEHASHLKQFMELQEKGYHPTLAYLLSYSRSGKGPDEKRTFPNLNHFWFDTSSSWKNIIDGNFVNLVKTSNYKVKPQTAIPTNMIWGVDIDTPKMISKSDEELAKSFNLAIEVVKPPPAIKKSKLANAGHFINHIIQAEAAAQQVNPVPVGGIEIQMAGGNWNIVNNVHQPANVWQLNEPGQFPVPAAFGNPDDPQPEIDDFDDINHDDFEEQADDF